MAAAEVRTAHRDAVLDVAFDHCGRRMATCGLDHAVSVFAAAAGGAWTPEAHFKASSPSLSLSLSLSLTHIHTPSPSLSPSLARSLPNKPSLSSRDALSPLALVLSLALSPSLVSLASNPPSFPGCARLWSHRGCCRRTAAPCGAWRGRTPSSDRCSPRALSTPPPSSGRRLTARRPAATAPAPAGCVAPLPLIRSRAGGLTAHGRSSGRSWLISAPRSAISSLPRGTSGCSWCVRRAGAVAVVGIRSPMRAWVRAAQAVCAKEGAVRIYEAPDSMNLSVWSQASDFRVHGKGSCTSLSWSQSRAHTPLLAIGCAIPDGPPPAAGGATAGGAVGYLQVWELVNAKFVPGISPLAARPLLTSLCAFPRCARPLYF